MNFTYVKLCWQQNKISLFLTNSKEKDFVSFWEANGNMSAIRSGSDLVCFVNAGIEVAAVDFGEAVDVFVPDKQTWMLHINHKEIDF